MKLSEMKELPKTAGIVKIEFTRRNKPFREGKTIFLPNKPWVEFYPLKKGKQFLFRMPFGETSKGKWPEFIGVWFGGTDEKPNQNPFLLELFKSINDYSPLFEIFKKKGEKAFYKTLKPEIITKAEEIFEEAPKRQGTIWAVRFPYKWEEIIFYSLLYLGERLKLKSKKEGKILGTLHRFTGSYLNLESIYNEKRIDCIFINMSRGCISNVSNINPVHHILAEGIIDSPDHSPMVLKGVHILARTKWLAEPRR